MSWITFQYSKKSVQRAGDYLIKTKAQHIDVSQYVECLRILNNWRSSHAYPMQSMVGYFRKKAFEVDKKAIIVRRLKRTPSILAKLRRESKMKLDRMEDIGGVRIVVSNITAVRLVSDKITSGRTRNVLRRKRDYIDSPKNSGYRGIHLVYRYKGSVSGYPAHNVEVQIRSIMQHAWATTVEVIGTYTRQGLKASAGDKQWLNFLSLLVMFL